MSLQKTFVMFKPDAVQRQMMGELMHRFERKGLRLAACKFMQLTKEQGKIHYEEHKDKPFFMDLVQFITSGPVLAMVWSGEEAIAMVRKLMGPTKVEDAPPGTMRGDFAHTTRQNLVHGSDGVESAAREIALYFKPEEIIDYPLASQGWMRLS